MFLPFEIIIIFLSCSFFGWLYESFIFKKYPCDSLISAFGLNCPPLLTLYGFGGVILYIIQKYVLQSDSNIIILSLMATIMITALECFAGKLSYIKNGHKTWNYNIGFPLCNGYISLFSSSFWFLLSIIFLTISLEIKK